MDSQGWTHEVYAFLGALDFVENMSGSGENFEASTPDRPYNRALLQRRFRVKLARTELEASYVSMVREANSLEHLAHLAGLEPILGLLADELEEAVVSAPVGTTELIFVDGDFQAA